MSGPLELVVERDRHRVEGPRDAGAEVLVANVRVAAGGADVGVPEELLQAGDVAGAAQ
jgi:hypothetical protein